MRGAILIGIMMSLSTLALTAQDDPAASGSLPEDSLIVLARDAATAWLDSVDAGAYLRSWQDAASFFRAAVKESDWVAQLSKVRRPLGAVLSRTFIGSQYATDLPHAPEGEYVVMQFTTRFEAHPAATETVTPMKDEDGVWRVAGYYIK